MPSGFEISSYASGPAGKPAASCNEMAPGRGVPAISTRGGCGPAAIPMKSARYFAIQRARSSRGETTIIVSAVIENPGPCAASTRTGNGTRALMDEVTMLGDCVGRVAGGVFAQEASRRLVNTNRTDPLRTHKDNSPSAALADDGGQKRPGFSLRGDVAPIRSE